MITIATIILAFATTNSFAQIKTPSAVVSSFERTFAKAETPIWSAVTGLYRVDFSVNKENLSAFFSAAGELIATSRDIAPTQLPISLQSSLEKHFGHYTVSSLFEIDQNDGIFYYAKVNNQKSEILLKSTSFGEWVTN